MTKRKKTKEEISKELAELKTKMRKTEKRYMELKEIEKAMEEQDRFLREVFSSIQDGISILDNNLRIIRVNATMEKWYSHAMPVVGKKCYQAYHGREEPCEVCPSRQTIQTGKAAYEVVPKTGIGQKIVGWLDLYGFPLFDSKTGKMKGVIEYVRDISDRKKAEEALRESQERYQLAITASRSGAWEINLETGKAFFDSSLKKLFGYGNDELNDFNQILSIIQPEQKQEALLRFEEMVHGKLREHSGAYLIQCKDGSIAWFQVYCILVCDSTGKPLRIVGISRDITEQKQAEVKMAALQEQLQQSQKMEAIGRLAGGIAHDFNNLLTIIQGNCELSLLGLPEDNPLKNTIEDIRKSAERASTLTRQLLAFSRRQIMEMRALDLNDTLHDLNTMLRRMIGEDIQLVTILTKNPGKVKADTSQIEQVIMNLVVNARDAMPQGGKLIMETSNVVLDEDYARTHIAVTPGHYVLLSISDTGCGMTPEVKERIFEPFFTTKEKGKGTGLGLAMAYGIIKQSEGNIWVYSEPGKGTTFKIYLPRVDELLPKKKEISVMEELPHHSGTILVVEDDEMVRKLAVRILERKGYKVHEATGVAEALQICTKEHYAIDLVLTDVVMPIMSGRELAKNLKELQPSIKILYMSGYPNNTLNHHEILEADVNYIQKPFTVESLIRKIRKILDKD